MNLTYTVDSNIFIYSIDIRDSLKHRIATQIMGALFKNRGVLPLQCLTESYAASVRKKILHPETLRAAIDDALFAYRIIPSAPADLPIAIGLHRRHNLQFFDCLLLSSASRAGCNLLFSEDMQHGQTYGSLTVRNPFKLSADELASLLA